VQRARKAYVPGLVALLVALLGSCSAGGRSDSATIDAKPGGPTEPAPSPGKYRTLREPCGSVSRSTLKDLLPGAASLPEDQQQRVYQGKPAVTYDTDRRVGCSWKIDSPDASHQLVIDVERVVSYNPKVSDDERAREVYTTKETAAELPLSQDSAGTSEDPGEDDTPQTPGDTGDKAADPGASTDPALITGTDPAAGSGQPGGIPSGAPPASPSGTPSSEDLQPRRLKDLGNAAFLDDVVSLPGSAAQQRTVSVVFRTSNVIVTVEYTEQPAHASVVPDSKELQEKARGLAKNLADQLNE
jgi:hypothetical protein